MKVSYLKDEREGPMDLKHLFRAGLLLGWIDSELPTKQELEQDTDRSRIR